VNRVLNHLIGGWNINGLFTRMTGEPFSVRSGVFTANFSHQSRADLIGPMPSTELQAGPGVGPYVLSPSLVTDPTNRSTPGFKVPLPGEDGAGRNIFKGPGYWNVDLGVTKYFQLTEDLKMQFRAEGFNAFNHANFDHPVSASVGSPSILSTVFGQSCCATVAPPSTQTVIQTGESGRIIQFALKLMFRNQQIRTVGAVYRAVKKLESGVIPLLASPQGGVAASSTKFREATEADAAGVVFLLSSGK